MSKHFSKCCFVLVLGVSLHMRYFEKYLSSLLGFGFPGHELCTFANADVLKAQLLLQVSGVEVLMWGTNPSLLMEKLWICEILSNCRLLCQGGFFCETVSLPLLPISK